MLTRRGFLLVGVVWSICPGMAAPVPVPVPITVSPSDGAQQAGIKQICTCASQHEFPKEFQCKTSELTIFEILQSGNFTKCPYFFKFEKPTPRLLYIFLLNFKKDDPHVECDDGITHLCSCLIKDMPAPTADSPSHPVPSTFTPTETVPVLTGRNSTSGMVEDDTNEGQRHHWPVVIYAVSIIVCFSVFICFCRRTTGDNTR